MRQLLLVPVAAPAACGGEPEQKAKAPGAAQAMQAGQWQSTLEVTNFRRADPGEPRLDMPVGTRTSGGACIGPDQGADPPPELFAGSDFEQCRWAENFYMRRGRLVSGMTCQRDGVGEVEVTVNVDFTATGFEGTAEMPTRLPTDGDVVLAARISGSRTGECTPEAETGNQAQPG